MAVTIQKITTRVYVNLAIKLKPNRRTKGGINSLSGYREGGVNLKRRRAGNRAWTHSQIIFPFRINQQMNQQGNKGNKLGLSIRYRVIIATQPS
jgi:hypothetical protein